MNKSFKTFSFGILVYVPKHEEYYSFARSLKKNNARSLKKNNEHSCSFFNYMRRYSFGIYDGDSKTHSTGVVNISYLIVKCKTGGDDNAREILISEGLLEEEEKLVKPAKH